MPALSITSFVFILNHIQFGHYKTAKYVSLLYKDSIQLNLITYCVEMLLVKPKTFDDFPLITVKIASVY